MKSYRISPEGLEKLCAAVFAADGMDPENAKKVAASLVEADLRGVSSHGTVRLKSYVERSHKEHWTQNPKLSFTQTLPAVALLDGDAGFGSLVGTAAMEKAMELAKIYGVGICAVKNSSHFGMAAYYPLLAARQDMLGFACTNGMPNLAPFGGREGMLGTNPFSIALPAEGEEPLVLDVACSVTARGNVSNYKREGKELPEGWCMDADGNPTRDPAKALKGTMLPFGGHKGSGLAVFVDMLSGILSGAAYGIHLRDGQKEGHEGGPGVGHFFLAADLKAFGDPAEIRKRIRTALDEIRASKPAPGFTKILMPGDLEAGKYLYNKEHGILMGEGSWKEICETCEKFGLDLDPQQFVWEETEEDFLKK